MPIVKTSLYLAASLALEGRSLTLLQEVKAIDDNNCPRVHQAFLLCLKASLPADCRPIIVTDAGFKVPWLKQIRKLGWHYIARVRGNQTLQLPDTRAFISVNQLYKKARTTPQCLGKIKLTSSQRYVTTAVLVGTGWKLRKRDKHKSYKEPWLLVSSLAQTPDYALKIAKCYNARMQIEESFRDQKTDIDQTKTSFFYFQYSRLICHSVSYSLNFRGQYEIKNQTVRPSWHCRWRH